MSDNDGFKKPMPNTATEHATIGTDEEGASLSYHDDNDDSDMTENESGLDPNPSLTLSS